MTQEKFQDHVLQELSKIKDLFVKNERDHGELSAKIESVRTEVESVRTEVESVRTEVASVRTEVESVRTEVESVRTEIHKSFNSHLRWSIGTAIGLATLVFVIVKFVV